MYFFSNLAPYFKKIDKLKPAKKTLDKLAQENHWGENCWE